MNRNERRKYLKSLGLDESTMRMMEEAQRISDMFEPYRESIMQSIEVVENFQRSHFGVLETIAEKNPAFLEFNNSKAISDLAAVAGKYADTEQQLSKVMGSISLAQDPALIEAMRRVSKTWMDNPSTQELAATMARIVERRMDGVEELSRAVDQVTRGLFLDTFSKIEISDPTWELLGGAERFRATYLDVEVEAPIAPWRPAHEGFSTLTVARSLSRRSAPEPPTEEEVAHAEIRRAQGIADSKDLEVLLESRYPRLLEPFRGARLAASIRGADYQRHVGSSCRAMIEAVLDLIAPPEEVLAWTDLPEDRVEGRPNEPTRPARERYALRKAPVLVQRYLNSSRRDVRTLYREASALVHPSAKVITVDPQEIVWRVESWLLLLVLAVDESEDATDDADES